LAIGLTIVAFGTSAPELAVSLFAAMAGNTDIAIGNIVGSNITNIVLILGVCGVVAPLVVKSSTVWKEIPFALLAVILVYVFANDMLFDGADANMISRSDGIALISIFLIFLAYVLAMLRHDSKKVLEETSSEFVYGSGAATIMTLAGLAALFGGGKLFVFEATELARLAGLSEALIGVTVVAVGTSLPELMTSVIATYRKATDIAVGNIVGSNIFNVFWILGASSIITPLPLNPQMNADILVAVAVTALLFLIMFVGRRHYTLSRLEGAFFLLTYAAYLGFVIARG
jgi:cation:H+ antiporter